MEEERGWMLQVKELSVHCLKVAVVLYQFYNAGFHLTLDAELKNILQCGLNLDYSFNSQRRDPSPSQIPMFGLKQVVPNIPGQDVKLYKNGSVRCASGGM